MRKAPTKMTASRGLYTLDRAMKESLLSREFSTDQIRHANEYFRQAGIEGCIYCGSLKTERWDHLIPTQSGGGTVLGNMVPACQPCDDSKGSKDYRTWLAGSAPKNPASNRPDLIAVVVGRVAAYQEHFGYVPPKDFLSALDAEQRAIYGEFLKLLESFRTELSRFGLLAIPLSEEVVADQES